MLTYVQGMFIKTANFRLYLLAFCLLPYALCLLYMQGMFIKTANFRDMKVAPEAEQDDSIGTRFTCFTGTKAYWYKYK
jgi:hypothetical protein